MDCIRALSSATFDQGQLRTCAPQRTALYSIPKPTTILDVALSMHARRAPAASKPFLVVHGLGATFGVGPLRVSSRGDA
jgi:hypothetical protein